jgi:hypothetical protein
LTGPRKALCEALRLWAVEGTPPHPSVFRAASEAAVEGLDCDSEGQPPDSVQEARLHLLCNALDEVERDWEVPPGF